MSRIVIASILAATAFPAMGFDLLGSDAMSGRVQTDAYSYDLDVSNSDNDLLTASLFTQLPMAVASAADSQGGPGSANASLSGSRVMNGVLASGSTVASASGFSDGGSGASGVSEFEFSFTLSGDADFVLDWEFMGGGLLVTGVSEVSLVGPGNAVIFFQDHGTFGTISGQASGMLGAGAYTLHAMSMSSASGGASGGEGADASFSIGFSVVPAPGAGALLGLAGVIGVRRRRAGF